MTPQDHHRENIEASNGLEHNAATPKTVIGHGQTAIHRTVETLAALEQRVLRDPQELTKGHRQFTKNTMHEETANCLWQREQKKYERLLKLQEESADQVYGRERLTEAFDDSAKVMIGCIDERVVPPAGWRKIALAGSSVLLNDEQCASFANHLNAAGVQVELVTFHEGCGACAIHLDQIKLASTEENKNAAGHTAAERLMRKLSMDGTPERSGYSAKVSDPRLKMDGDPHLHHARAIVIDGTGHFSPTALGLPAAFETSPRYLDDPEYAYGENGELGVALAIAFGEHGFGLNRFDTASKTNNAQPIAIVLVEDPASPHYNFKAMKHQLQQTLGKYPRSSYMIVRITPPSQKEERKERS